MSVNVLATVAQYQLMFTYFAALLIQGEVFEFSMIKLMTSLVIANLVLIIGALGVQYISGSAALEAELRMLELEFRENETQLNIAEMRSDIALLQKRLKIPQLTDVEKKQPAASGRSKSISHTAATAAGAVKKPALVIGGGKICEVSFTKAHYPCFVLSHTNLCTLGEIITHEDANSRELLETLTHTTRAPSCAYTFFISQNVSLCVLAYPHLF